MFVFQSPRNGRVVTVADASAFAYALLLEFDPTVRIYVERPRQLQVTSKTRIDLSFWSERNDGSERFDLIVPATLIMQSTTGSMPLPGKQDLVEIGTRNGVNLTLVTEQELASQLSQIALAYELLPLVWDSGRISARAAIAEQIKALLERAARLNLLSLAAALPYTPNQVRATVAWMVHQGVVHLIDHTPGASDAVLELVRG
ncbi:hypothetical protein [Stenotrophomonas maltophilia]|uniref:hypothetical protein n=1 Tax=Stenotrophomonas maltophilia TaxID=40324 RepID=UPI0018D33179|nr:hypothetical protein [Stenotrophomonas maltophilia]EMB2829551.1 hypothetical protein [Stenotrophomonas maltophilia]MBH1450834.1 hypothetical protein [Stenotrophomonas maltophilia]MBH1567315.1 hypothetical protein [Stenotrophomonas maltophilia]MBH1728271.1 hypothetical protein [Stenotrophomonas maltophilia]MBN5189445.1 hypothetical protein [Stenotrophomonas maltophilia]